MSAKRRPVSSSVLTVLASISAPYSPVDALPPFLYPYPPVQTESTSIHPRHTSNRRPLVDKYEQEEDGRWRRVEDYTLYGSRVCSNCETVQPSPSATSDPTQHEDFVGSLPNGWRTQETTSSHRDSVVMALSIVLAIAICLLAVTWFHHREKRIKRMKKADIELRPSSSASNRRTQDLEVRSRLKAWASATARWRYNARYSARQRRGKRVTESMHLSSSLVNSRDALTSRHSQTSLTPTRSSIRSSSPVSSLTPSRSSTPTPMSLTQTSSVALSEAAEFSPPAYHHPDPSLLSPPNPNAPAGASAVTTAAEKPGSEAAAPGYSSSSLDPEITFARSGTGTTISYAPSHLFHSGHAATDDKNILSRLASEPPAPAPLFSSSTQEMHSSAPLASAPEWKDEELLDIEQDFPEALASSSSQEPVPAPPFPCPPPSHPAFHFPRRSSRTSLSSVAKGKMAMAYAESYEDDPEMLSGPSAPPFTESPFYSLEACAPPAFDEEDAGPVPSAPSFDQDEDDLPHHTPSRPTSPSSSAPDVLQAACSTPLPDSPTDCRPVDSFQDLRPG